MRLIQGNSPPVVINARIRTMIAAVTLAPIRTSELKKTDIKVATMIVTAKRTDTTTLIKIGRLKRTVSKTVTVTATKTVPNPKVTATPGITTSKTPPRETAR